MEWLQAFMIAGSTVGAVWLTHRENKQISDRFNEENKLFHGRLCTLEERYLQILQAINEKKN